VAQAVEARREELQPAKQLVEPERIPLPEELRERGYQREAEKEADEGGERDEG
jgi:hypothetical protein